MQEKPAFSRHIFWETNYDKIDWENKPQYVIERVVEYGNWEDWKLLKAYYGMDKIRTAVLHARFLRDKTHSFFSLIFDEPMENFRCYSFKQSNPIPFPS